MCYNQIMDTEMRDKVKKGVTIFLWVCFVAWACNFFYKQEVDIGRTLPLVMAAQSLDSNELSYIYEADINDIYNGNTPDEQALNSGISVYMYEDASSGDWGRVIIYDKSTTTFKYIIRTKAGAKITGEASFIKKGGVYVNDNNQEGMSSEGCEVDFKVKSQDKIFYNIKNVESKNRYNCDSYGSSTVKKSFLPGVLHKLI